MTNTAHEATHAAATPVVGHSHQHESARLHVSGSATYTDDIAELHGTLHAALGLSTVAHARLRALDLSAVRAAPGVLAVLCAADFPGTNQCGPIIQDEPILAEDVVEYVGQAMFIVVANSHEQARRAARLAQVDYELLPAVLDARAAHAAQSYVLPPLALARGDAAAALATAAHSLSGQWQVGGQEQFYLEGQIAYALPQEDGALRVLCSTQHPSEMQHIIAHALALPTHSVQVECRRMGGAFGGKESQSSLWAAAAALCAWRLQRPVKLRADRDDDMQVTGKRHDFHYAYEVGYDDSGLLLGARLELIARAGYSADLSGPVATRAICHVDNTYFLSDVDIRAFCAKTNTQSNTAFRGFGGPQGALLIEHVIDEIARALGLDPLDVRKRNFYGRNAAEGRNVTHYGQTVVDNVIHELVAELEESSAYRARRVAIAEFNARSPILKKGLALTPHKFGIAFNVTHLNQAGALVHVYLDGSILVNHGGTEMGQGLHTKVLQVVAHELGVPLAALRISASDTAKIANTSATAASTGADLNGKAAQDAARRIRLRLAEFAAATWGGSATAVRFEAGTVAVNGTLMGFAELVQKAYLARVQLWSDGFYATPQLHWNGKTMNGNPFAYYAYGAAVSEVQVDTLTGEWKLLRVDALYDAGQSLNPALDIGQVEGAFIQGMGWLTTEELVWNAAGKLMTHAPSTYKIPAISDCPEDFRVALFNNSNPFDSIHRSKAVGEPPLLLPFSVFFAIRDAISSLAGHRHAPALAAPATSEAILRAISALPTEKP
ncbi:MULTISPECIES: xanthine dehydrogenase molybdopterin binding subunit [unclassified Undibacterium]|uniref:xanthine dehydrogenase molybdopterin binding subunit n=1 Tax=unclassified Undibacterium TaxID=2630295 RepID=UPI002AC93B9A|nr:MULTISPECIES: xanthine dehydrogenase molybdopterin binding subunit [unclassified Undibacterium]MEB0138845.1 xanthine dehydrogenase molybdopterin binding subunit [Undibacterium sp. CCC2.1]MEB0172293.1 xanthine dehydrogenase molybdopterin binding subunit [Undibacterium sp. CCC1.1]MEB0176090.1 xanthine dehydrogenase molybdopterin binding subunit [Undibacterium sp. CCC3.4]MEB0215949.1 xanthine dehydrogenase molybdopterin binding subunit [Undibacterium sp. 5I2]WPX44767.1 xanthine dehydrogenase m